MGKGGGGGRESRERRRGEEGEVEMADASCGGRDS